MSDILFRASALSGALLIAIAGPAAAAARTRDAISAGSAKEAAPGKAAARDGNLPTRKAAACDAPAFKHRSCASGKFGGDEQGPAAGKAQKPGFDREGKCACGDPAPASEPDASKDKIEKLIFEEKTKEFQRPTARPSP